jgi:hypothetical protein
MKKDVMKYYKYVLVYVDDLLVISEKPGTIVTQLSEEYQYCLKDVGSPTQFLGANIAKKSLNNLFPQRHIWKRHLRQLSQDFNTLFGKSQFDTPAPMKFHPEVDTSDFLDDNRTTLYHSYIGILRWAIKLG